MTKYELTFSFLPTMCNGGAACPKGTIVRGMVLVRWKDGVRAGNLHPACALREGWDGTAPTPAMLWEAGTKNVYIDHQDSYELMPMGDGSGRYVVLKNQYRELVELPSPGMPKSVPVGIQAQVAILAEIANPFLPTNNPKSVEKALARRAAEVYNTNTDTEGDGRVADPEDQNDPPAKESNMAAVAAPVKKSFLSKAPVAAPAPAPGRVAKVANKGPAPKVAPVKAAKAPRTPKEPAVKTAATDEEINAAVAGNLRPRPQTPGKKQAALTQTDEKGRPKGRPLGVTTGLPILLAWCLAFQENSKTPGQSQIKGLGRQPDEAISRFMKSEFPGRTTPAFDRPAICRNDYNSGRFTKNALPRIQSDRYDENGTITTARGGLTEKAEKVAPAKKAPAPAPKAVKAAPAPAPKKTLKA